MIKLKLDDEPVFDQASIWAISSDLGPLRLAFKLNEAFNLRLTRDKRDHVFIWRKQELHFCSFSYNAKNQMQNWHLTANKQSYYFPKEVDKATAQSSWVPLVPELRHYDHFLWCEDYCYSQQYEAINLGLKQLPYVKTFQRLTAESTRSLKNLLTEI